MAEREWALLRNGDVIALSAVAVQPCEGWRNTLIDRVERGDRIAALFAHSLPGGSARLWAVLARDRDGTVAVGSAEVRDRYPSITVDCPAAHWFEREIAEQCGVRPEGHP